MNILKHAFFLFFLLVFFTTIKCLGQNDTTTSKKKNVLKTEFSTEFNSAYVWRGMYNNQKPNIQPSFSVEYRDFAFGVFGSNNLDNTYREFDYFFSYSFSNFVVTLNDYFCDFSRNYGDYGQNSPHLIDLTLEYETGEVHQFAALASCLVYGDDKWLNYNVSLKKTQNYSTYIQTSYTYNCKEKSYTFLVGGTTHNGLYSNNLNITNIGFEFEKKNSLTSTVDYSPKFGLWVNPYNNQLLFSCGVKF